MKEMMNREMIHRRVHTWIVIFLAIAFMDILLKWMAMRLLFSFSFNSISFAFVPNPYIAFGLSFLSGKPLLLAHTFFLGALFFLLGRSFKKKQEDDVFIIGICAMLFGALNNYMDRLIYGYVIDYISISFSPFWQLSFNLSDLLIVGGFCVVLYHFFLRKQKSPRVS